MDRRRNLLGHPLGGPWLGSLDWALTALILLITVFSDLTAMETFWSVAAALSLLVRHRFPEISVLTVSVADLVGGSDSGAGLLAYFFAVVALVVHQRRGVPFWLCLGTAIICHAEPWPIAGYDGPALPRIATGLLGAVLPVLFGLYWRGQRDLGAANASGPCWSGGSGRP